MKIVKESNRIPESKASKASTVQKRDKENPLSLSSPSRSQAALGESIRQSPLIVAQQKRVDRLVPDSSKNNRVDVGTIQGKFPTQLQEDEEDLMQGKFPAQLQEDEEDLMQGKFPAQLQEDEEEMMQGKFSAQLEANEQDEPQSMAGNQMGVSNDVQAKMEGAMNSDFSGVQVHPNSSKAVEVGALAYTQGSDIHFAPGQFAPDTSRGKQLLGHELTHVVQQQEGRVQATTEVAGLPVNDNPSLEKEADIMGEKASRA